MLVIVVQGILGSLAIIMVIIMKILRVIRMMIIMKIRLIGTNKSYQRKLRKRNEHNGSLNKLKPINLI